VEELPRAGSNISAVQRLFLKQQLKATQQKDRRTMRWHPTVIRWCMALRRKSRSAYRYLRESGALSLPSESTIDDYTAYREINSGIDIQGLLDIQKRYPQEDVAILCDEMKVRDGLVYQINTGNLVGYTDIDTNTAMDGILDKEPTIATHALVFMLRGLKSNLTFAAATYATTSASAEDIYLRFWELVGAAELIGVPSKELHRRWCHHKSAIHRSPQK
jgi:hypothetical protein